MYDTYTLYDVYASRFVPGREVTRRDRRSRILHHRAPMWTELRGFDAATPELMARRELLQRIDAKFAFDVARLPELIGGLAADYAVLPVAGGAVATYRNVYFDTPSLRCFHDHRRGRRIRSKVRIRHYPERALSFVEVKTKRGASVTDKRRLAIPFAQDELGADARAFVCSAAGLDEELAPAVRIDYRRIALVNKHAPERLTIDLDLVVSHGDTRRELGALAIVELKRSLDRPRTPALRALAAAGLRERSLSKYCAAVALVRPDVRHNRLRPDLRVLEALR